jgi:hypothetical protein
MSATRRRIGWAVLLSITLPARWAGAQTGAREGDDLFQEPDPGATSGEEAFRRGRAAMNDGNYELARIHFSQSYYIEPTLGTLLNLAVCEEKLGRLVSALTHLNEALAQAPLSDKRRPFIATRLDELEKRTPRLTIRPPPPRLPGADAFAHGAGTRSGIVVALDSRPLDRELPATIRLDPGQHELTCAGPRGERCAQTFAISEGANAEQVLTIALASATLPEPPPAHGAPPPEQVRRRSPLAYGLGGLGLAAIAGCLVTGVAVLREKKIVNEHCDASGCDATGLSAAKSGRSLSFVSTALGGVGVMALGGALLLPMQKSTRSMMSLSVSGRF